MDYQAILNVIEKELESFEDEGKVADYIPELAFVPSDKFGMHLHCIDGGDYSFGNSDEKFSIQSISKVFSLALAKKHGSKIWKRVDVEPSGDPFNSLTQLEKEKGIPRNPFINAGAIVIADMIVTLYENPKEDFLDFLRAISGSDTINYNPRVAQSEKDTGFRNRALANFLKSFGNIENDVDEVLDFYFHQCSVEMS